MKSVIRIGALCAALFTVCVHAEQKPLWEAGLGVGALVFPDYRGSDEVSAYPLPMPYFVYRGPIFKADRDGMRGELFDSDRVELTVSGNATIPVNSEHNEARRGMPDLKPTLEIGPSLDVHVWRSKDERLKLDLVLPVRVPVTLESSPRALSWLFSPRLNLDVENIRSSGWDLGVGAGPLFASNSYHDYFYAVSQRYATADRPRYDSSAGYSGTHFLASLTKRYPKFWIGGYVRYDALSDSKFEDSPLYRRSSYIAGGIGIAWIIGRSKRFVEVEDDIRD